MLWVNIKKINRKENVIYIPQYLAEKLNSQVNLEFGARSILVSVKINKSHSTKKLTSYNAPLIIDFASQVFDELLINDLVVYRMNYLPSKIAIGPVIGLLLGEQHYYYHNKWLTELTESMLEYEKVGGLYLAFKHSSIDWKNMCIYGLYYNHVSRSWVYSKFPIPSVVFLRGFQSKSDTISKLKAVTGNKVFNSVRIDKWQMYKQLIANNSLIEYIPETMFLDNLNSFNKFITKYQTIVLKPVGLSRGRGIYFLKKIDSKYILLSGNDYRTSKEVKNLRISKSDFSKFLSEGMFFERNYIMQPKIEFAKVNGNSFDIRVVLQKNEYSKWQCTGIECRIAGPQEILTNIARGGQALPLSQTVQLAFGSELDHESVRKDIIDIGMDFCNFADSLGELFAEFGLDIALDVNKKYWFIEANVRPTFKGFKKMDYQNYLEICSTPLLYAAALAGFRREV